MKFDLLEAFDLDPAIIAVLKEKYGPELLPIQEKAIKERHILSGGNFIIFAATSAGKTLVGEILSLFNAGKRKRVFYLVPTKALAEEKYEQFCDDYAKAGIQTVISTHDRREFDDAIAEGSFHIAVIVYEKLQALLVNSPKLFTEVGLIVVDELQYISEEDRGQTLELLLTRILLTPASPQLVGLSAVLGKSERLAEWLNAEMLLYEKRPVELRKGVFFDGKFRYSEFNSGNRGEEVWFSPESKNPLEMMAETAAFLADKKGEQTVLFLKDKPSTEAVAMKLAELVSLPSVQGAIDELMSREESVSRDLLVSLLENGIGIHNADFSWEERDIVERYVKKGEIRLLCSTTTLAVGMNLPMKNAILDPRKWKFDKKTKDLTRVSIPVSDFENMGGRVGRFGFVSDFGRAVLVTNSYVDFKAFYERYVEGKLEALAPALDMEEIDKHILNLIASGFSQTPDGIRQFLKATFTGRTVWKGKLADEDYDRIIQKILDASLMWGLVYSDPDGKFHATQTGKIAASKGVMLETVFHFLDFLKKAEPSRITDLEILTLISFSKDAYLVYIPMKMKEKGYGGYRLELQWMVSEGMEEEKEIFREILERSTRLAYEEERAVKKALMLLKWISPADTKDVENGYLLYSGAIRRAGEDFSRLAETLAELAKEMKWPEKAVTGIELLSRRLIYGVTEAGLKLSLIRLRGLDRGCINRLAANGYDTPEAIAGVPLGDLEKILPERLARRLHSHCKKFYGPQGMNPKGKYPAGESPLAGEEHRVGEGHPVGGAHPAGEGQPGSEVHPIRPFAEIAANDGLLARFCSSLALTDNLAFLATDAPEILIDEKQSLFFYAGFRVELPPTAFRFMALMGKRPGEVVSRSEIYDRLWPEMLLNPDSSSNPYDRQISDHKRKIAARIKKATEGEAESNPERIKALIKTRRKVGYMLDLKREEVCVL